MKARPFPLSLLNGCAISSSRAFKDFTKSRFRILRVFAMFVVLLMVTCTSPLCGQQTGTWKPIPVPKPIGPDYRFIDFADSLNGWLFNYIGEFVKTSDGGRTWIAKKANITNNILSVKLQDSLNAMLVTAYQYEDHFYKTTDGGDTWIETPLPDSLYFPPKAGLISLLNKDLIGFVSSSHWLYLSRNGGESWDRIYLNKTRTNFSVLGHLEILSEDNMFIGGGDGMLDHSGLLSQSTDGGITWVSRVDTNLIVYSTSKFFSKSMGRFWLTFGDDPSFNYTWLCNFSQKEAISVFGGWDYGVRYDDGSVMLLPITGYLIKKDQMNDSLYVFNTTFPGGISTKDFVSLSKTSVWLLADSSQLFQRIDVIDDVPEKKQTEGYPSQGEQTVTISAFPNPTNGSMRIEIGVKASLHRVNVFVGDILGRTVMRLFQGELTQSVNQFSWFGLDQHGAGVASGTYYITVVSENGITTKPILYVK